MDVSNDHRRIHQLDPLLANQIAAGEVVERPASVVKELIENSIDAGAKAIEVEIEGGGVHLIRVRDNGVGIVKADLPLAFSRHATSKIAEVTDLFAIRSLGFRGEALASIASVSRCRLMSHARGEENAWQIQIASDLTPTLYPVAHPIGTTMEVADLFYNTPVRRKFLRSERTEFQAIDEIFKRLALSYPQISFTLKHQQRQIRYFPALSEMTSEKSRMIKICGQSFIEQAIHFEMEAVGLDLKGWVGLPHLGTRQADCQFLFVNQRAVKDKLLNHAIKNVYSADPRYQEGTYPCYVLFLTLDPKEVDVNVHPTKQEVRFGQPRLVHDFMTKCINQALNTCEEESEDIAVSMPLEKIKDAPRIAREEEIEEVQEKSDHLSYQDRYRMKEDENGVTIIDLVKAKTSILTFYFEQNWGAIDSKPLLFPVQLNNNPALSETSLQWLKALGFVFRISQDKCYLLAQPRILGENAQKVLQKLFALNPQKAVLCETLADQIDLECMDLFSPELLTQWLKSERKTGYLYMNHAQIEALCHHHP